MRTGVIYKYTNRVHEGWSYIGQTVYDKKHREGSRCKNYNKCVVLRMPLKNTA